MKTVAQWAEQLPELIKIEFLYETEKQEVSNRILVNPSATINAIIWIDTFLGTDFWHGVASCFYETPKSADYIDESVPYTKEEVEAMILEYADPNDEVCQQMLLNIGIGEKKELIITQSWVDEFNKVDVKKLGLAPSANAKPIVLDELDFGEFLVEAPKVTTVDYDFARRSPDFDGAIEQDKKERELFTQKEKANIEASMVSALDYFNLRSDYFGLKKENEALKREVEAGKGKIEKLAEEQFGEWNKQRKVIFKKNDEIIAKNERIAVLERELKATQEAVAPKKEQSIFFDLLKHLNIIKK